MATKKKAAPGKKTAPKKKTARRRKPKPIPDDFPNLSAYLVVRDMKKAIDFYQKAFGLKMKGEPMKAGKMIMHAVLEHGDSAVMLGPPSPDGSHVPPDARLARQQAFGLFCYVKDVDAHYKRVKRFKGITCTQPETMFWGDRVYDVVDRDGHHWSFASCVEALTPAEMEAKLAAMMAAAGM